MEITLTREDYTSFRQAAEGMSLSERKDAVARCHAALTEGYISARKFAKEVRMSLDDVAEAFEEMGMENPIGL